MLLAKTKVKTENKNKNVMMGQWDEPFFLTQAYSFHATPFKIKIASLMFCQPTARDGSVNKQNSRFQPISLLIAYQHISWPVLNFNTFLHAPVHTYSSVKPFFSPIQTQIKTLILLYFQQYNVIPFPPWQYHVHCFFRCDDIQMWPYRHDVFFVAVVFYLV